MTQELLNHIEGRMPMFRAWVGANEQVQISNDAIQPLLTEFKLQNPTHDLSGNCKECILDVVRWAMSEFKNANKPQNDEL